MRMLGVIDGLFQSNDQPVWDMLPRRCSAMTFGRDMEVGVSFLIKKNHLTFFKSPRVISRKINFSAKVPSKCPLKLAISEGIFHFYEKNLQKGVGKYTFKSFLKKKSKITGIQPNEIVI